jgi:hypothetical protein
VGVEEAPDDDDDDGDDGDDPCDGVGCVEAGAVESITLPSVDEPLLDGLFALDCSKEAEGADGGFWL